MFPFEDIYIYISLVSLLSKMFYTIVDLFCINEFYKNQMKFIKIKWNLFEWKNEYEFDITIF